VARHRGGVALCFGRQAPEKPGELLDLDLVSMAIVDQLTRFFEHRKDAAEFVRAYWPQWLVTLSRAEDAQEDDYIFFVGGRADPDGVSPNFIVRAGHFNEVTKNLLGMRGGQRPTHFFYVDMWQTADAVRAAAKREGVALGERFFYALDDPRCEAKILEELGAHNDRITRERKAGKPRAVKAKTLAPAEVRAIFEEARHAVLQ
jgi:hypothetical protein